MIQPNPFFYGNPVSHKNFIGRTKELRRVTGRLQKGESTAIIGDPHIGKTSFLAYLTNKETRPALYGDKDQYYFSRIDSQMLGSQFTPPQFWEQALSPIKQEIHTTSPQLAKHYKICQENSFGNFTLERLFFLLKKISKPFILLLDEFDALLHHPVLNSAEFYGGLRALASRSESAFALIIASRASLSKLNSITQEFNPTGSPFFNIFSEITLGPLTDKDVTKLFSLAENRFEKHDKQTIRTLAGKHPYLLQAACAAMWDAYEDEELYRPPYVTKRLYQELDLFFTDTWRVWTPEVRKAFTSVAIAHQARFMPQTSFLTTKFIKTLQDWGPELNDLEEKGLIEKNEQYRGGYRVSSEIMLTWLADELVKAGRTGKPFESWLQDKGIDGAFLSVSEKKVFEKVVRSVAGMLGQGAKTMIDAFAKQGPGLAKKYFDQGVKNEYTTHSTSE